jgi:hypothetical protein
MHNVPFRLDDFDCIQQSLQKYCEKFFSHDNYYAEYIDVKDLTALVPDLVDQVRAMNINLEMAGFMCTPPGGQGPIHIDGSQQWAKYWVLNLPVYNCDNTAMIWWHSDAEPEVRVYDEIYKNSPVRYYDPAKCVEVERCSLIQPTWVNVSVPHSVENVANTSTRMILTMRFDVSRQADWHPTQLL